MTSDTQPIRRIRDRLGWTQKRLAAELGVSQPLVCAYERGDVRASPKVAIRLVKVAAVAGLQISLDHVYGVRDIERQAA